MLQKYTLPQKFTAMVAIALLAVGVTCFLLLRYLNGNLADQVVADKGESSLNALVEMVRGPLVNQDVLSTQVLLQNAVVDRLIFRVEISDTSGRQIAQSQEASAAPGRLTAFSRDIDFQGNRAGSIRLLVNDSLVRREYGLPAIAFAISWLLFSAAATWIVYRTLGSQSIRIQRLLNRLPGGDERTGNELDVLEHRLLPLLAKFPVDRESSADKYHYCVFTGLIKNRALLDHLLNREGLNKMLVQIDYCLARTLELYGGQRLHGSAEQLRFFIRSSRFNKQLLLVSLMAAYTLQQLLQKLGAQLGAELQICWGLSLDDVVEEPVMLRDQQFDDLFNRSKQLASRLEAGAIGLNPPDIPAEELQTIAELHRSDEQCLVLVNFPPERQLLLDRQLQYLCGICL